MKKIKVACLGNMNNNFFALMRYLRDLGVDAHLFYPANMGMSHFLPEKDAYNIDVWKNYVYAIDFNVTILELYGKKQSVDYLLGQIKAFDIIICDGFWPAFLYKKGVQNIPIIFVPYSLAIEGAKKTKFFEKGSLKSKFNCFVRNYFQRKAFKKNIYSINVLPIDPITSESISRYNLKYTPISCPMVYLEKDIPGEFYDSVHDYIKIMEQANLVVFYHSRQSWKTKMSFIDKTKKTDVLIRGFFDYLKISNNRKALLVLFEYGVDIAESKRLIRDLNIENQVLWIPLLARKKIMILLKYTDVCASQFGCEYWGGVGLEIMASGKLMMQHFTTSPEEYLRLTGMDLPNILRTYSREDVCRHLLNFMHDKENYIKLGKENKKWFDKFAGLGLAEKYLEQIQKAIAHKRLL